MSTTYHGATETELGDAEATRRVLSFIDQRRLFPHHGPFRLEQDAVVLEGWLEVPRSAVTRIDLTFTERYTRVMAGGARGGFPSLGLLGDRGKPLLVTRIDDEPLYLLLGYRWLPGTTENAAWLPRVQAWHQAAAA